MKKSAIPKPTKAFKPNILSFDEIYTWIKAQEGEPSYTAKKDGKLKDGTQLYSIGLGHQIQPNELELMNLTLNDDQVLEIFKKAKRILVNQFLLKVVIHNGLPK